MDYNFISLVGVFIVMLIIGSILNILLKTTSKINWMMTLIFSMFLSIVFTTLFN
ncbi:hypothetical protein [Paenisporosarcina antarctica]|uniref:hypothetical protein n=1 Tax=Paenisporosarcina antarctica TaxID=417367 RepID=UPI001416EFE4|nr:hypothetical protein [Paenisporosarcina antarctica]